jgi:uncharacterized protein YbjT (DUF2867 family)
MAFMELLTDRKFFPPAAAWHLMPALMGPARPLPWVCTDDLGAAAGRVFADPGRFVGRDLPLAGDVQTLAQCRALYRDVVGRDPRRVPLPAWLFARFGFPGQDLTAMWRWLRTGDVALDTTPLRAIHPAAVTVRDWLTRRRAAGAGPR